MLCETLQVLVQKTESWQVEAGEAKEKSENPYWASNIIKSLFSL